ncbi:hypothetical protein E0H73_33425 [Kribbella pittospori]|uniref:HAF repeat-containing protein n=1 Tax=Kribbella pittospori TaxID=722689 RepID=A0A4R0K7F4_9ACTN|nr:hypothetical protein [Kribbella pittospori]TCC56071.1 hypothetical protein E0H73_33425 [Kribbella pittospori]
MLALGIPVLAPVATAAAAPPEQCLQHPMATLPELTAFGPSAVAPGGRFVSGGAEAAADRQTAVQWIDGVPENVGMVAEYTFASDVNDAGQLVVLGRTRGSYRSFIYDDGTLQNLPTPPGYTQAVARFISNTTGVVAGVTYSDASKLRAVIWGADHQPHVLPVPDGFDDVTVNDIDEDGTVVGSVIARDGDVVSAAYWLPDGTVTLLPGTSSSEVTAVRDGVAVGTDSGQAVRWVLGSGEPGTPFAAGRPVAIAGDGTVLMEHSVITPDGVERQLEQKHPDEYGVWAAGIDDNHQVYGLENAFTGGAVRWDCS